MRQTPEQIARKAFVITLRGYDRYAVEEYLSRLAEENADLVEEMLKLREELAASTATIAPPTADPPAAPADDTTG